MSDISSTAVLAAHGIEVEQGKTPPRLIEPKPLRLADRLANCILLVHGIGKEGKNENQGYSFVREVDVMASVRGVLARNGVIVVPRVARVEFRSVPTKNGTASLTDVHMVFAVMATDTDEVFECPWYGCGADTTDKGGNKAITSAEKYFLLKLLKIPTEADPDKDSEEKVSVPAAKVVKPKPAIATTAPAIAANPRPSVITRPEIEQAHTLAKKAGLATIEEFRKFLIGLCDVEKVSELSRQEFTDLLDVLQGMADAKGSKAEVEA